MMDSSFVRTYRKARVSLKKVMGTEPRVEIKPCGHLERHGSDYCSWQIPSNVLKASSVVVDVGLGEDISFSESLIHQYGCDVHGLDPTPKAILYVKDRKPKGFYLHELGLGAKTGTATFYLPNESTHVSGSIVREYHVGDQEIEVNLLSLEDLFKHLGVDRIDLLKIDIEGAEFGVFESESFARNASRVGMICIEFHHRWKSFGVESAYRALEQLSRAGFKAVWANPQTNEEFTFVRTLGHELE